MKYIDFNSPYMENYQNGMTEYVLSDVFREYSSGENDELDIYVDESGNLGNRTTNSLYHVIGLVFKAKSSDISEEERKLEEVFSLLGYPNHCFHTGPLIHGDGDYSYTSLTIRQKLMRYFFAFYRKIDIAHKEFFVEKKNLDEEEIHLRLAKEIRMFVTENLKYLTLFQKINIFYDNGQIIVSELLIEEFKSVLSNVEIHKVKPSSCRLFQVADFVCTLRWLSIKAQHYALSKTEQMFFEGKRNLIKKYIKFIE